MRLLLSLLLLLGAALAGPAALAHNGLPVAINIEQRSDQVYRLSLVLPPSIPSHVQPSLSIEPACQAMNRLTVPTGAMSMSFRCANGIGGKTVILHYDGGKPAVATLVRITWQSGEMRTVLAAPGETRLAIPRPESPGGVFRDFVRLGIEHILAGWDHLIFLLCLIIIARTPKRILLTVTGFTIGHALTITLVSLGAATLPLPPVEAAIALSIMFLAAEIIRGPRQTLTWRYPVAVSSTFGILHGFGFASALHEIGLPQTEVPMALLAFNLGIEAGQLVCVAAYWALAALVRRVSSGTAANAPAFAATSIAYLAGSIAAYWFMERTIGMF